MGKYQPALIGGVAIGLLSAVPVVNWANCCCLWVIAGGALTAYLQQQKTPEPLDTGDAVLGGLIAGIIGAVIMMLGNWLVMSATGGMMQDEIMRAIEQAPDMPEEMRENMRNFVTGSSIIVLMLAITLPVYAVFAMLGSLLGLAIFRKKPMPPAPPIVEG
jgi:hypothetical protein